MVIPKCGGEPYEDAAMVFIVNPCQAATYVANGAKLYDCMLGYDNKFLYVFKRAETWQLYRKWKAHTLTVPDAEVVE